MNQLFYKFQVSPDFVDAWDVRDECAVDCMKLANIQYLAMSKGHMV